MPRISAKDLPPQAPDEEEPGSGLNRQGSEAWENPTRSAGIAPSPQNLRDSVSNPTPGTSTKDDPAQDNRPALPYGRLFEKRLTPGFRDQGAGQVRNGADKAELRDLVHRTQGQSTPKPQFSDLVYRSNANPEDEQDRRRGLFQNVADTRPAQQTQSAPQARPTNATPQAPQTFAQSSNPLAQAPASKPTPVQGAAPQKSAANSQPPKPQLTPEDQEEIHPTEGQDKGKERKPIGQLAIRGGEGFAKDEKPKTVCLYDGSEARRGKNDATALSLQRAAREYASKSEWMIDISQPGWQAKLQDIQKKLEGEGTANDPHKGIDRIMFFDHASSGHHEFGSTSLMPHSPEWKTITSCIKPQGDIVLAGCETAKTAWDRRGGGKKIMPDHNGPNYLKDLYYSADTSRGPTIHAYDENVRHRTYLGRLSLTAGRQHSVSTGGYQMEGPEEPPD